MMSFWPGLGLGIITVRDVINQSAPCVNPTRSPVINVRAADRALAWA